MREVQALFERALRSLNRETAKIIIRECCVQHNTIQCVEEILMPVMENIGTDWEHGNLVLSQGYMSGRICEEIIEEMAATASKVIDVVAGMVKEVMWIDARLPESKVPVPPTLRLDDAFPTWT